MILYTTDGFYLSFMERGSLNGSAVYTVGDFQPTDDPSVSFKNQKKMNEPGNFFTYNNQVNPQISAVNTILVG